MAKSMQTTAAMAFVKLLLTIFNLIFWLTGLALLVIGIVVLIGLQDYLDLSKTNFTNMPYILVGTGLFMIAAGVIGCCSVVKNLAWFLQLFGIMIIVVFVALMAAGVFGFIYRGKLKEGFYSGLNDTMMAYTNSNSDTDIAINNVQNTIMCCGVENYKTWEDPRSKWQQTHPAESVAPLSCCNDTVAGDLCKDGPSIPFQDSNGTMLVYQQGCYEKVQTFLDNKLLLMSAICIGFALFQLVGAVLSFCLASLINKNKYEMV